MTAAGSCREWGDGGGEAHREAAEKGLRGTAHRRGVALPLDSGDGGGAPIDRSGQEATTSEVAVAASSRRKRGGERCAGTTRS
jgi:hypothetical protein